MISLTVSGLTAILFFAFYLALGFAASYFLFAKKNGSELNAYLKLSVCFYMGIGAWYAIATALGLTGHFNLTVICVFMIVSIGVTAKPLIGLAIEAFNAFKNDLKIVKPASKAWKIIFWMALALACGGVLGVGNTAMEDGAAFYLPIAKMTAYSGWLEKLPGYEIFSAVGLLGELQMASLMLFKAADAARVMGWICFLPLILVFVGYAKKMKLSAEAYVVTLLCVFGSTAVMYIIGGGKIDLFSGALGLIGLYLLYFEQELLLAGFLIAFACVAKLSLFIPFFPLVVIGLIQQARNGSSDLRTVVKKFLIFNLCFAAIFVIVLMPHLIKNYIFFENPWAPFYGTKFSWETTWYAESTVQRILWTYPLVWFYGGFWGQMGTMSLPILMFLPLYFKKSFLKIRNWEAQDFLLAGLMLGMTLWMIIRPSFIAPRYILAVLLGFAPFAAAGFDRWRIGATKRQQAFVYGVLLVFSVHSFAKMRSSGLGPEKVYSYLADESPKCKRDGQHCFITEEINKVAVPGARILHLSYFTYWLREDLLQTMRRSDEFEILPGSSAEDVWKSIYQQGFEILYIDRTSHADSIQLHHVDSLPVWVSLEKIAESGKISAYKIVYSPDIKFSRKIKTRSDGTHWVIEKVL